MSSEIKVRDVGLEPGSGAWGCTLRCLGWAAVIAFGFLLLAFWSAECKRGEYIPPAATEEEMELIRELQMIDGEERYMSWFFKKLKPRYRLVHLDGIPGLAAKVGDVYITRFELSKRMLRRFWNNPLFFEFRPVGDWSRFTVDELASLARLLAVRDQLAKELGAAELARIRARDADSPHVTPPEAIPGADKVYSDWFKQYKAGKRIEVLPEGEIAARVDGEPITRAQLELRTALMHQMNQQTVLIRSVADNEPLLNLPQRLGDSLRAVTLGELINETVLAQGIRERGMTPDNALVHDKLADLLLEANGVYFMEIGDRRLLMIEALGNIHNDLLIEFGADMMLVEVSDEEVDEVFQARVELAGGQEEFEGFLRESWMSADDYRTRIRRELLQERLKPVVIQVERGFPPPRYLEQMDPEEAAPFYEFLNPDRE